MVWVTVAVLEKHIPITGSGRARGGFDPVRWTAC